MNASEKEIIRQAMSIMGSRSSPRKTEAARKNAQLAGRPMKYGNCPKYKYHHFHRGKCSGCGLMKSETRPAA